jgi:uracil-DNA glycosylase
VVVFGLAPAAHGANRTGRYFTGDRSGDFLFGSLYRAGYASSPASRRADDGMRLRQLWISAAVRCAPPKNKPTPPERDACLPYAARELELLPAKVLVCLGAFAWDAALRIYGIRPKPKFGHGTEYTTPSGLTLLGCYHPSQQNTFTGVLTEPMLDAVLLRARDLAD